MEDRTHPRDPEGAGEAPSIIDTSIARRREILRRLGQASAAAGLASPLAALAGGSTTGTPWCYQSKVSTTCVHASISGCGSVLLSAQAHGPQCNGKSCSYYTNSCINNSKIPTSCQQLVFKKVFSCSGSDSLGTPSSNWNCLFNKTFSQILCSNNKTNNNYWYNSAEAHWVTAYCNSTVGYNAGSFPYQTSDVCGHYSNAGIKADAYNFYCNYMENG